MKTAVIIIGACALLIITPAKAMQDGGGGAGAGASSRDDNDRHNNEQNFFTRGWNFFMGDYQPPARDPARLDTHNARVRWSRNHPGQRWDSLSGAKQSKITRNEANRREAANKTPFQREMRDEGFNRKGYQDEYSNATGGTWGGQGRKDFDSGDH